MHAKKLDYNAKVWNHTLVHDGDGRTYNAPNDLVIAFLPTFEGCVVSIESQSGNEMNELSLATKWANKKLKNSSGVTWAAVATK